MRGALLLVMVVLICMIYLIQTSEGFDASFLSSMSGGPKPKKTAGGGGGRGGGGGGGRKPGGNRKWKEKYGKNFHQKWKPIPGIAGGGKPRWCGRGRKNKVSSVECIERGMFKKGPHQCNCLSKFWKCGWKGGQLLGPINSGKCKYMGYTYRVGEFSCLGEKTCRCEDTKIKCWRGKDKTDVMASGKYKPPWKTDWGNWKPKRTSGK